MEPLGVFSLTIPATIHSTDCVMYCTFDARSWFRSAKTEEVIELARNGWGGEYVADGIARHEATSNPAVADVLQYVMYVKHGGGQTGYRCLVDRVAALEWLAYNRPDALAQLRNAERNHARVA